MAVSPPNAAPRILIVGSGPSGLMLALSLARNGVPVRIIEKSRAYPIGQRGAGTTPRSLELYEALGILNEVQKLAIYYPMFRIFKMPEGVEVVKEFHGAPMSEPTPARPYLNHVMIGQDNLERILRGELQKFGCTVELGAELQSLEQSSDTVEVKILKHNLDDASIEAIVEEASFEWVVGADGAKGVVRKQLGLTLLGETRVESFLVGDVKLEGLPAGYWNMWGEMSKVLTCIRSSDTPGLFNIIIGGSGLNLDDTSEVWADDDAMIQFLKKGTGNREDIKYGEVIKVRPYRVNIRMVDTFKKGRVFVIGDAAHVHSPAGGQGMNTGIQDAFNLGWKLALVAKGLSPAGLLESFNAERLPVVAEMLNITTNLMKKTIADSHTQSAWDRTGPVSQLGVNYRGSSIVVDEEDDALGELREKVSPYYVECGAVHAGDRAPDATGLVKVEVGSGRDCTTRLFELFDPTRHTVLIFADKVDYDAALTVLQQLPKDTVRLVVITKPGQGSSIVGDAVDVFEDCSGHAYDAYDGPEGKTGLLAIRPDGVVGARVGGATGLKRYFEGIFTVST